MKNKNLKFKIIVLNLLFFFSALCEGQRGYCQQLPGYSQYMYNDFYINPAVAGLKEGRIPVMMTFRRQWAGMDDAPITNTISGHGQFLKNNGAGIILLDDRTGPITQTGVQAAYAYHARFNENTSLSFGVSGMFYQHILDKENLNIEDKSDKIIQGGKEGVFSPDANFGIYFKTTRFYAGGSVPQLIQANLRYTDYADLKVRMVRHYFFYSGYRIVLGDKTEIDPSFLLKAVDGAPIQYDVNLKFDYRERIWAGVSYRNEESVVGLLGFRKDNFSIAYSYDFTLTDLKKYSTGSHELIIKLDMPKPSQKSSASFE